MHVISCHHMSYECFVCQNKTTTYGSKPFFELYTVLGGPGPPASRAGGGGIGRYHRRPRGRLWRPPECPDGHGRLRRHV